MEVSLLSHLTNSVLIVQIIKWLRGTERYQRFAAWLPIADGKVHVVMSGLGAALSGLGMHAAVEGDTGVGWKIAIAIPPLWVMFHAAWDWAQQMTMNQLVYAVAVQQKAAAPVITVPITKGTGAGTPSVTVTTPVEGN